MKQNQIEQSVRLKKLIKALNLNQSEFAKRLGMTQPNISRMVNGSSNISIEVLNRITERYRQINLHWLLTGKGDMFFAGPDYKEPQMRDVQVAEGKGKLEELEERVGRLEDMVKELMKKLEK